MRAARYFAAIDSHTEGMPTRVITGGVGPVRAPRLELDDAKRAILEEALAALREPVAA